MRKDAFYFSHDANAQSDPKILRLLSRHSWHGYGLFWAIVEMLRNEPEYKLETDYETYAFALRTDSEGIRSVVEDFGLFVVEDGVFFSESLVERMGLKDEKSKKASMAAKVRWNKVKAKQEVNADALQPHIECNAKKEKERKEKERKEKINSTKPERPEFISSSLWKALLENRKFKKLQNTELALKTFCNSISEGIERGYTAEECIGEYVSSSWKRFNADWMKGNGKQQYESWDQPSQQEKPMDKRSADALELLRGMGPLN